MTKSWPSSMPALHRSFAERSIDILSADARVVGVAAGGSFLTNAMDEFSDLDLVIAVEPDASAAILTERNQVARSLGILLTAF